MSTYAATQGGFHVVVRSGMPEEAVRIGVGSSRSEAIADLSDTPIQSDGGGGCPEAAALRWASGQWGADQVLPWGLFEAIEDEDDGAARRRRARRSRR